MAAAALFHTTVSAVDETHFVSAAALEDQPRLDMARQLEFPGSILTPSGAWQKTTTLVDTGASACFVSRR